MYRIRHYRYRDRRFAIMRIYGDWCVLYFRWNESTAQYSRKIVCHVRELRLIPTKFAGRTGDKQEWVRLFHSVKVRQEVPQWAKEAIIARVQRGR